MAEDQNNGLALKSSDGYTGKLFLPSTADIATLNTAQAAVNSIDPTARFIVSSTEPETADDGKILIVTTPNCIEGCISGDLSISSHIACDYLDALINGDDGSAIISDGNMVITHLTLAPHTSISNRSLSDSVFAPRNRNSSNGLCALSLYPVAFSIQLFYSTTLQSSSSSISYTTLSNALAEGSLYPISVKSAEIAAYRVDTNTLTILSDLDNLFSTYIGEGTFDGVAVDDSSISWNLYLNSPGVVFYTPKTLYGYSLENDYFNDDDNKIDWIFDFTIEYSDTPLVATSSEGADLYTIFQSISDSMNGYGFDVDDAFSHGILQCDISRSCYTVCRRQ